MQPLVRTRTLFYALLGAVCADTHATELLIDQKDKQFSKRSVKIKVGDAVEFRNSDSFGHNLFSLSNTKSFDLRSYH